MAGWSMTRMAHPLPDRLFRGLVVSKMVIACDNVAVSYMYIATCGKPCRFGCTLDINLRRDRPNIWRSWCRRESTDWPARSCEQNGRIAQRVCGTFYSRIRVLHVHVPTPTLRLCDFPPSILSSPHASAVINWPPAQSRLNHSYTLGS